MHTPTECPNWDGCSAPVCPLNQTGKHLRDEPICYYAMELVKPKADQRFADNDETWLLKAIAPNLDWLQKQSRDLKKRLAKSARTPSRMTSKQPTNETKYV